MPGMPEECWNAYACANNNNNLVVFSWFYYYHYIHTPITHVGMMEQLLKIKITTVYI